MDFLASHYTTFYLGDQIGAQAVYMWRHRNHLEKTNVTLGRIAFDVVINAVHSDLLFRSFDYKLSLSSLFCHAFVEFHVQISYVCLCAGRWPLRNETHRQLGSCRSPN